MRILSLSKFSIINSWSFLAVGGALPLTMLGGFSKAATVVSKLPFYSLSSFYGPLLSTYIVPVIAVISVVNAPLSMEVSAPSFRAARMHTVVTPEDSVLTSVRSVTSAKASVQNHTQSLHTELMNVYGSLSTQGRQEGVSYGVREDVITSSALKPFVATFKQSSATLNLAGVQEIVLVLNPEMTFSTSSFDRIQNQEKLGVFIDEIEKKSLHFDPITHKRYVKALEGAIHLFKRLPSALTRSGITADFFNKNDWMSFSHGDVTSKQVDDIIEGVVRYFLSKCKDLINCVPCQRTDEKTELSPDFIEKFISRIDKQSYYVEPTRKALRFLVDEKIISEDYVDNVIKRYSI